MFDDDAFTNMLRHLVREEVRIAIARVVEGMNSELRSAFAQLSHERCAYADMRARIALLEKKFPDEYFPSWDEIEEGAQ